MATKQSAQILLKLLDKVPDSKKLDKLLEPENLLRLLQIYGQNQDDIRQKLASGTLPGELLLELLEREPDPDRLLAQLGISAEKSNAKQDKAPTPVPRRKESEPGRNLLGSYFLLAVIVLISLTAVVPALIVAGFLGDVELSREVATIIALVGGAAAGAIADPKRRFFWKGTLVGITYGVVALWATILYTQARTSIIRIELVIPLFIAIIPAFGVYYLLSRLFPKK